jgi:hypothetical protein
MSSVEWSALVQTRNQEDAVGVHTVLFQLFPNPQYQVHSTACLLKF